MYPTLPIVICGLSAALLLYTYVGYPALLWLVGRVRDLPVPAEVADEELPSVSISVPAYNEVAQIHELIESLLALDYPRDRLQILIVSDCSSDGTDDAVREYHDRGIELLRMPERGGKTRAENAAAEHLTGDIIVNTDASIRIDPGALKRLVAAFSDPSIGLASGRDRSVTNVDAPANAGEAGYVGYEMKVRDLETRVSGIIGASGCFYAIRAHLHRLPLPGALSRDFAAALHTREHGYRPVSVSEAACNVPRTPSLKKEYRRKVRTITRGMETLWHKRALLNPLRFGGFPWMLLSHKIFRWALPWAALATWVSLATLAPRYTSAAVLFGAGTVFLVLGSTGWVLADRRELPTLLRAPAYVLAGNVAAAHAFVRMLRGERDALWEPTRRGPASST